LGYLSTQAPLESRFAGLPRDCKLITVCQVGGRSLKTTNFLMYLDFDQVANLDGGIPKLASKSFPVRGDVSVLQ
jgi:rhodanese-related sulfurtransferase